MKQVWESLPDGVTVIAGCWLTVFDVDPWRREVSL